MCQSEAQLEESLISNLIQLGYERINLHTTAELHANLKRQLELHNKVQLSEQEFAQVLMHLNKGNIFDKAHTLRAPLQLSKDDGSPQHIEFLNTQNWCQNQFQVANQIRVLGNNVNRYDVTILINGLPLVQIELKRRGMELKEAFNQIKRYHRTSYGKDGGLFHYIQLFIISNGVNTRYFANNPHQDFKQTFHWTTQDNAPLNNLQVFTEAFLEKCHLSKMISRYIVLHQSNKIPMILRPYQYYAVEAILTQVENGRNNGYIWHTTGSGKTLTSFKAAQQLRNYPKLDKIIFVVDRADLDYQTTAEFNYFEANSVDGSRDTSHLVAQLQDPSKKLIITTIQKLNNAITGHYSGYLDALRKQRIVFIFDECHRSQFGETHRNICNFFERAQMFGFTGTPILAGNAKGNQTTKTLFHECLHRYVITDAINDHNVLPFSIDYWGKVVSQQELTPAQYRKVCEDPKRVQDIVDLIITNHDIKTHNREFSAIMCVHSKDALITYYNAFKAAKHDLRIAAIYTSGANEEDAEVNGLIGDPSFDPLKGQPQARAQLEVMVQDYNKLFDANHSVADSLGFYTYYKDIAKRLKEREFKSPNDSDRLDILLVVNMFLTGFDAKKVNTLYVDKNLRHHGLIQAFSRTNRTIGPKKSHGNIVCFRDLKENTDEAITLFSNEQAKEVILLKPYKHYVDKCNEQVAKLVAVCPTPDAVDTLKGEEAKLGFISAFREVLRNHNTLKSFAEFSSKDILIHGQTFQDYLSKYKDLHETLRKAPSAPDSILTTVDFELELIQTDEITVDYILKLLSKLHKSKNNPPRYEKEKQAAIQSIERGTHTKSKQDVLIAFINNLPNIQDTSNIAAAFEAYWDAKKQAALTTLCEEEFLDITQIREMDKNYRFTQKLPLRSELRKALLKNYKSVEQAKALNRISQKFEEVVITFDL